jgi:hypothetical protein
MSHDLKAEYPLNILYELFGEHISSKTSEKFNTTFCKTNLHDDVVFDYERVDLEYDSGNVFISHFEVIVDEEYNCDLYK